jgi:hypothetical protein
VVDDDCLIQDGPSASAITNSIDGTDDNIGADCVSQLAHNTDSVIDFRISASPSCMVLMRILIAGPALGRRSFCFN